MSFTVGDERRFQSTKTSSKEIATKIWKKRDGEIALGLFKIGWPGERMTFAELCDEFRSSHSSTLSMNSQRNHRMFSKHLRQFFGDRNLIDPPADGRGVPGLSTPPAIAAQSKDHCQRSNRQPGA